MLKKQFHENWMFEAPAALLTCSILKCKEEQYLVFGGHDRSLYLMNEDLMILDDIEFDGWCRCTFPIDINGDGCQELLVGSGDRSFLVLRLNQENKRFKGILRYQANGKVTCCTAGDLYRNGKKELIFGSEDKTVRIFDDLNAKNPCETLYFDSWITALTLGYIQNPKERKAKYCLLIGNKNANIQMLNIENDMPNIIWQKNVDSQINAIQIGDVTNDGFNEILLATNDRTIKILDAEANLIDKIELPKARGVSLFIKDIDADNINEILVGCADGNFYVYKNKKIDSIDFQIKWKKKVRTSIKDITCCFDESNDQLKLFLGGYERTIRCLSDMDFNKIPKVDVPKRMKYPEEVELSQKEKDKMEFRQVATNIREYIIELFEDYGIFLTLDTLKDELLKLDYSPSEISEELDKIKAQDIIKYEKLNIPVWTYTGKPEDEEVSKKAKLPKAATEEIEAPRKTIEKSITAKVSDEARGKQTKQAIEGKPQEKAPKVKKEKVKLTGEIKEKEQKEKTVEKKKEIERAKVEKKKVKEEIEKTSIKEKEEKEKPERTPRETIIQYLKNQGIVSTKNDLIEAITQKGFKKGNVTDEIDYLNDHNIIQYSRSKPRGWSLIIEDSEKLREVKEKLSEKKEEIEDDILAFLEKEGPVSSKSSLVEAIVAMGYGKSNVENHIDKLNDANKISYSRSKPRGWNIV